MAAFRCFMRTEMDVLFLEDHYILKKDQSKIKGEENLDLYIEKKGEKDIDNSLLKKLDKLYQNNFISISKKATSIIAHKINGKSSCWLNCTDQKNIDKIFIIPSDLDTLNPNPKKMSASIIESWHNTSFGEIVDPILKILLSLSKKYPLEEDTSSEISDKIYEMF